MRVRFLLAIVPLALGCAAVAEDPYTGFTKKDGGLHGDGATDGLVPVDDTETPADDTGAGSDTAIEIDSGEVDSTTPLADSGTPDSGTPDSGTPDTGTPDTGTVMPDTGGGTTTFLFPKSTDARYTASGGYFWNAGDYYKGSRSTTLSSVTSFSTGLELSDNVLSCDSVHLQIRINGTLVGTQDISSSAGVSIPISFTFSAVSGPSYEIEYRCGSTVASGCGSIEIADDVSNVTLK